MWPFTKKKKQSAQPPNLQVKVVTGMMPAGDAVAYFIPEVTYESKTFAGSTYHKGMTYTLRQHNLKLAQAMHKWASEGKIRIMANNDDPLIQVVETGSQG